MGSKSKLGGGCNRQESQLVDGVEFDEVPSYEQIVGRLLVGDGFEMLTSFFSNKQSEKELDLSKWTRIQWPLELSRHIGKMKSSKKIKKLRKLFSNMLENVRDVWVLKMLDILDEYDTSEFEVAGTDIPACFIGLKLLMELLEKYAQKGMAYNGHTNEFKYRLVRNMESSQETATEMSNGDSENEDKT